MSCKLNGRYSCVVILVERSVFFVLLGELLCKQLSHMTFVFQIYNQRDNRRIFLMQFLERKENLTPYPRGIILHFDLSRTQLFFSRQATFDKSGCVVGYISRLAGSVSTTGLYRIVPQCE